MTTPDGIATLEQMVERLTAENARLRAKVETARACAKSGSEHALHLIEEWRATVESLTAENSRLRADLAAEKELNGISECGRLRAERDGLLAAVELTIGAIPSPADPGCDCADCKACRALRAAVAACAPEVKP